MSAVETLVTKPPSQGFQDCACPTPVTATLERGADLGVKKKEDDCACPDVAPVVMGVATFPVVEAPVMVQPAGTPAIRVNVVVPQA